MSGWSKPDVIQAGTARISPVTCENRPSQYFREAGLSHSSDGPTDNFRLARQPVGIASFIFLVRAFGASAIENGVPRWPSQTCRCCQASPATHRD